MKIKNLLTARNVIFQHKDDKIPSSLAYKLMKFLKASDSDEAFYNEKLKSLIEEYSVREADGKIKTVNGSFAIQPSKVDVFNKEAEELRNTEVDIPQVKFSIKELEPIRLSITDIYSLDEFITE